MREGKLSNASLTRQTSSPRWLLLPAFSPVVSLYLHFICLSPGAEVSREEGPLSTSFLYLRKRKKIPLLFYCTLHLISQSVNYLILPAFPFRIFPWFSILYLSLSFPLWCLFLRAIQLIDISWYARGSHSMIQIHHSFLSILPSFPWNLLTLLKFISIFNLGCLSYINSFADRKY